VLAQIATPPNLDTGILCIFLSFGISTSPSFLEKAITKGTIKTPNIYDIIAPIIFDCGNESIKIVLSSLIHIKETVYIVLMIVPLILLVLLRYLNFLLLQI